MRDRLSLDHIVADLNDAMRSAWDTAAKYAAALSSRPSDPEMYEEALADEIQGVYVRLAFALESLQLTELLKEFKDGFAAYRENPTEMKVDYLGNLYPAALMHLLHYLRPLRAAVNKPADVTDALQLLERILVGTPKVIRDRQIVPSNESDVRNALYQLLLHPFPDTVRDIPISKVSKTYKPDIGIRSLGAAIEYKFIDSEVELQAS